MRHDRLRPLVALLALVLTLVGCSSVIAAPAGCPDHRCATPTASATPLTTTFFPTSTVSTAVLPAGFTGTKRLLSLTRGAAAVNTGAIATIASLAATPGVGAGGQGWGSTLQATHPKDGLLFISNPLNAVTLGGASAFNWTLRGLESNAKANYSIGFELYRISADGSTATSFGASSQYAGGTEVGTVETAISKSTTLTGGTDVVVGQGEYIVLVPQWIASTGLTTASGNTATGFYSGPTASATGDGFISFFESVSEQVLSSLLPIRQVRQAIPRSTL